ncbi:MAG TPA: biopolymer transporter ExbD [Burkholderiaceae bacterium]|nr:biopolymer transporter ExbD [Burkholderiaceae bacterium]HMX10381.1 biopolymer transporter ExbD [Burkholderiaceae bacterium]HMY99239.1 biopolymer transporter ExbD [Burkholderiaceae bacterium]HNB42795.1 biopolymer transporter ExbD [Burkholderiaceae bacterium]HNG80217.1 biopolymer transporter ExbD [Burkholderiaceae bacterium]
MGMNLGSGSGSDDEPIMDINTTPLIDVMLVLLVMLIITIPIQLHSVNLNMPVGKPPPSEVKPEVIKIDIDEKSVVYWQGVAVADRAELEAKMEAAAARALQPEIHIRPNRLSSYNTFAEVMVSAQRKGLLKLGVVGAEQFVGR